MSVHLILGYVVHRLVNNNNNNNDNKYVHSNAHVHACWHITPALQNNYALIAPSEVSPWLGECCKYIRRDMLMGITPNLDWSS